MPFLALVQSFTGLAMQFTDLELPPWGALHNCIQMCVNVSGCQEPFPHRQFELLFLVTAVAQATFSIPLHPPAPNLFQIFLDFCLFFAQEMSQMRCLTSSDCFTIVHMATVSFQHVLYKKEIIEVNRKGTAYLTLKIHAPFFADTIKNIMCSFIIKSSSKWQGNILKYCNEMIRNNFPSRASVSF